MLNRAMFLLGLSPLILSAGCGEPSQEEQVTALSETVSPGGGLHREQVKELLQQLGLRPEQRAAIDQLLQATHTRAAPLRKAQAELLQELARALRSGAIDRTRLTFLVQQLATLAPSMRPAMTAMLNQLHQVLDPAQRAKVVELIKGRMSGHMWRRPGRNFDGPLAKQLSLTDEQKGQLKQLVWDTLKEQRTELRGRHREMRQQLKEAADAFVSERFDAGRTAFFTEAHAHGPLRGEVILKVLPRALAILAPSQRAQAAVLLETRAKQVVEPRW